MSALIALAERVEKAEGPDRKLDTAIGNLLGWKPYKGAWYLPPDLRAARLIPAYTGSLDAAMTLVPKGFRWWFSCGSVRPTGEPPEANESFAQVWKSERNTVYHRAGDEQHGKIATPALALTAAALRARAAQEEA